MHTERQAYTISCNIRCRVKALAARSPLLVQRPLYTANQLTNLEQNCSENFIADRGRFRPLPQRFGSKL